MPANRPSEPFSCTYSPPVPELLAELDCSLVVSTYQAGKLILLASDGERIALLPRSFEVPMGIAVAGDQMAIATRHEIVLLSDERRMAPSYPRQPGVYDSLYLPRSVHYCGALDVHDLVFTTKGLIGVNTLFSCLFTLDPRFSFRPIWKPRFVTALAPEDRCHLNGLACENGEPRYVTALGRSDTREGWRAGKEKGGVLIDLKSGEIVLGGLAMPHSPRLVDGTLYALLSSTSELITVDPARGSYDVVRKLKGFVRGLAPVGDYLIIASSMIRKNHTFGDLGVAREAEPFCGLTIVHRKTGGLVAELQFLRTCEEIYDVQVLPGRRRPGMLGIADENHRRALSLPEQTFWGDDRPLESEHPTG